MVSSTFHADHSCQFVIRPNRSLTWRQQKLFFGLMTVVVLGIAIGFATMGFWPVLPFAGLELGVLAVGLWLCASTGLDVEVVTVGREQVSVAKGRTRPEPVWSSRRCWSRVQLRVAGRSWYPSRLVIRSHGREVQLASFLSEDERRRLAAELRRAVALPDAAHDGQTDEPFGVQEQ